MSASEGCTPRKRSPGTIASSNPSVVFHVDVSVARFDFLLTQQARNRKLNGGSSTPGVLCVSSPALDGENERPRVNALLIRSFSNLASNSGINSARQNPESECMSKLLGNTQAGDPSPLGNKAYSAKDSLRMPFRATRSILRIPSSAKSMKFREIASKAMWITCGVYKTSCRLFNSTSVLPFGYVLITVNRSEENVMLPHRRID